MAVTMPDGLEALVARARDGNRESLERLVEGIQRPVYNLAVRMLWHPEDARDATQEILIRVITHLGSFRGDSRLLTWVFRVAANYLITARQSRVEAQAYTFDRFSSELHDGLAEVGDEGEWSPDTALLLEEVKVGCMHGLLTCLDRVHRLAYILGEILEYDGVESARILKHFAGGLPQAPVSRSRDHRRVHTRPMRSGRPSQCLPLCSATAARAGHAACKSQRPLVCGCRLCPRVSRNVGKGPASGSDPPNRRAVSQFAAAGSRARAAREHSRGFGVALAGPGLPRAVMREVYPPR
jgi:RNA polymerase sigma factor (sigma-70 family)